MSVLVHHTMVIPVLREYEKRNNDDQFRMLTWNGVALEGAEDDNFGVQSDYPHTPPPELDWRQMLDDGELALRQNDHPSWCSLEVARVFFSVDFRHRANECWNFTPEMRGYGAFKGEMVLDAFVTQMLSFGYLVDLISRDRLPMLGVITALRDVQTALRTPVYAFGEVENAVAPEFLIEPFEALPEESRERLTNEGEDDNLFDELVDLNVVADFLVAKRAFRAWLRDAKKKRGEKRKYN